MEGDGPRPARVRPRAAGLDSRVSSRRPEFLCAMMTASSSRVKPPRLSQGAAAVAHAHDDGPLLHHGGGDVFAGIAQPLDGHGQALERIGSCRSSFCSRISMVITPPSGHGFGPQLGTADLDRLAGHHAQLGRHALVGEGQGEKDDAVHRRKQVPVEVMARMARSSTSLRAWR